MPVSGAVSGVLRAGSSGFTVEVAMLDGEPPASCASSCRGSSEAEVGRWGFEKAVVWIEGRKMNDVGCGRVACGKRQLI